MKQFYLQLCFCLFPGLLLGQVFFIDADNYATTLPTIPLVSISVRAALVRFVPNGKTAPSAISLSNQASFASVLQSLTKAGKVNLLYLGERAQNNSGEALTYESIEGRPAFSLLPNVKSPYTNREFGLKLKLQAFAMASQTIKLNWQGDFSWSPDLIHLWSGDKMLALGASVAKVIKPGILFTEGGDDDDTPEQSGINIGGLFGKKKTASTPITDTNQVSFLNVDFQQVNLKGSQAIPSGSVFITGYASKNSKVAGETIYLLLQPFREP